MSNIICMREWKARKLAKQQKTIAEKKRPKIYSDSEITVEFSKRIGGMAMLREWYEIFGDKRKK